MCRREIHELYPLVDVEERTAAILHLGMRDTDNEFVEDPGGTYDDIEVPGCDGVEGSRNNPAFHQDPAPLS
jgi:hypothetical protein